MATLLTAADLPSSDEEDVDFVPDDKNLAERRKSRQAKSVREAPEMAAPLERSGHERPELASVQAAKKVKRDALWQELRRTNRSMDTPVPQRGSSLSSLCSSVAGIKAAPGRQVGPEPSVCDSPACSRSAFPASAIHDTRSISFFRKPQSENNSWPA